MNAIVPIIVDVEDDFNPHQKSYEIALPEFSLVETDGGVILLKLEELMCDENNEIQIRSTADEPIKLQHESILLKIQRGKSGITYFFGNSMKVKSTCDLILQKLLPA